ncbi:MAG: bifunctional (p)ppGpp synthetase/guanosine-3',5'-bis(diphosphate) 3'-pyrophosphohydrolase [Tissierellia bacterium]|nr:bifunctional (p)ppGpp synthetase/guanosine-3',5'-bis(diphosphate) 3'-pyrophosphohydrolase [Tissierellia bacterium]
MIKELIDKTKYYNQNIDEKTITDAFDLAFEMHKGQKRNSGEDYIIHPFHVALILAELHMDTATIIAGLLHDVVEDTDFSLEDIEKRFGTDVAHIVDGVTKLAKISYKTKEEKQAQNIRKMVLAMANDIRVIIVKLADRLHNMRTLEYMTEAKKKEKAGEVVEIYAPLANRLGISKLKWELEDLALRYLDYDGYYDLVERVSKRRTEREKLINSIVEILYKNLEDVGIKAEISGRPKNLYSIYKKMNVQGRAFDEIYDLSAVRILVDDLKDCYGALGVVHNLWKPIPGRFKDYIAMPKSNMYQSLHTTVIDEHGEIFEVQIRTFEMHEIAEFGIAAHWKYKEAGASAINKDDNMTWLRQMIEWQQEQSDPQEFMEGLKVDFFTDEVFVFTPNGDVMSLAEGSTPIDFAYLVHTQVGHNCVGAKVNGRIVPLDYKLRNGNIVEIITDKNSGPSLDWINIVKSSKAKNKIRQYFKIQDKDRNVAIGKDMIEQDLKKNGLNPKNLLNDEWLQVLVDKYKTKTIEDLYATVGYGSLSTSQIVSRLIQFYESTHKITDEEILASQKKKAASKKKKGNGLGVIVQGADNLKARMAKCCNPVPGDSIIGFVTRGRGVTVHRADCLNISNIEDDDRLMQAQWDLEEEAHYNAEVCIRAIAKTGLLAAITNRIADSNISINAIDAKTNKDKISTINIILEIHDIDELNRLMDRFKNIENVLEVYRVTG